MGSTGAIPPNSPASPGHWNGETRADGTVVAPPAGPGDGVDARPSTELPDNIPPAGQKMKADADANSEEMWKMNAILMQIQHEQAMQKLVVEAASAIQKNAADVGEFMVNKI